VTISPEEVAAQAFERPALLVWRDQEVALEAEAVKSQIRRLDLARDRPVAAEPEDSDLSL